MAVIIPFPVEPEIHKDKINTFARCIRLSGIWLLLLLGCLLPGMDSCSVDPGDYHLMIRVTDREGWQTMKGISVKLVENSQVI